MPQPHKSTQNIRNAGRNKPMSETTNLKTKTVKEVDNNAIQAKEVILNIQEAAWDLDQIIDRKVRPKHPDKHIARPSQEDARNSQHKGWELLKYIPSKQDVEVVKSMDEASTTRGGNVLCWRDKRIQEYIDQQEKVARDISNRKSNAESTTSQARGINDALAGLSGGKIKARPLEEEE